jgi:hypothetical protein
VHIQRPLLHFQWFYKAVPLHCGCFEEEIHDQLPLDPGCGAVCGMPVTFQDLNQHQGIDIEAGATAALRLWWDVLCIAGRLIVCTGFS